MPDSVLDWDSLWDRAERQVDMEEIRDNEDFQQKLIGKFFRGQPNPKGLTGKHIDLADEMWERGVIEQRFNLKEIPLEQKVKVYRREKLLFEVALYKGIPHTEARKAFRRETTQHLGQRLGGLRRGASRRGLRVLRMTFAEK